MRKKTDASEDLFESPATRSLHTGINEQTVSHCMRKDLRATNIAVLWRKTKIKIKGFEKIKTSRAARSDFKQMKNSTITYLVLIAVFLGID